ncbi:hypothetical protein Tco_1052870, partial [Tanacetum coccineum]
QPIDPQHTSTSDQLSNEEPITVLSSSQLKKTHKPRKAKRTTKISQSSGPIHLVVDETVYKEWEDIMERAATTAFSLEAEQDSGHTPGSDEGRPNINDMMAICTNLSNRVLALEQSKTAQDLVIKKLKKKVRKLEKKLRARTLGLNLFKIGTSKRKSLDKENVSKQGRKSDKTKPMFDDSDFAELYMENVEGDAETQGRDTAEQITTVGDTVNTTSIDVSAVRPSNVSTAEPSISTARDIFKDEMMTIADTLVAIRSTRPRTTSVVIRDVEEEPRRATPIPTVQSQDKGKGKMVEPEPTLKNPIKTQIQRDVAIAQKLFEEEQAQFERESKGLLGKKAAEQEAKDAALIEQMEDIQSRIEANELLVERLQQEEREQFTIEEKSRMLVEMIAERKRFFAAQRAEQIRNKPPTRTQLRNKMITYLKNMVGGSETKKSRSRSFKEPIKRQKIKEASGSGEESVEKEKELSEEELQKLLVIVPVEEVYVEALQINI